MVSVSFAEIFLDEFLSRCAFLVLVLGPLLSSLILILLLRFWSSSQVRLHMTLAIANRKRLFTNERDIMT